LLVLRRLNGSSKLCNSRLERVTPNAFVLTSSPFLILLTFHTLCGLRLKITTSVATLPAQVHHDCFSQLTRWCDVFSKILFASGSIVIFIDIHHVLVLLEHTALTTNIADIANHARVMAKFFLSIVMEDTSFDKLTVRLESACFSSVLEGLGSFSLLLFRFAIVSAKEKAGLAGAAGAAFFSIDLLSNMSQRESRTISAETYMAAATTEGVVVLVIAFLTPAPVEAEVTDLVTVGFALAVAPTAGFAAAPALAAATGFELLPTGSARLSMDALVAALPVVGVTSTLFEA
ncbi:hypothetical protein KCU65_g257, partial [Aureobasidium melanogenum]